MTVKQATAEGLRFTGIYAAYWDSDIDEIKEEAKKIRALGFRACVVEECDGKSVYAVTAYHAYKYYERNKARCERKDILTSAEEECKKIMERAAAEQAKLEKLMEDAKALYEAYLSKEAR